MNGFSSHDIVKRFCLDPQNERKFGEFFYLCLQYSVAYLRVLDRRGYPLPLECANADEATRDIAIDLLPELFRSKAQQRFYPIFDFLRRRGISDFQRATAKCLHHEITILLRGNVRHALFHRRQVEQSQTERLKKNIKAALNGTEYRCCVTPNGVEHFYSISQENHKRLDRNYITAEELIELVQVAYNHSSSHTVPAWLTRIFAELANRLTVQNSITRNDLLASMVSIWANACDEIYLHERQTLPGMSAMLFELVAAEIPAVVDWANKTLITRFLNKQNLARDDVEDYLEALRNYLRDFAAGDVDTIPKYLYMLRPKLKSSEYQASHKFTFETLLRESRGRLREILQKNPTIRSLWDYLR